MNNKLRTITVTAIASAIAAVLMILEFPVPLVPSFIKMDVSETPALLVSFAFGPWWGALVCLIKNVVKFALGSSSMGVGELCNFLLGTCLVLPAGYLYRFRKTFSGAVLGSITGCLTMAAVSLPLNYFVTYPIYERFMPLSAILGMYQAIFPGVNGLLSCLLLFNVPFTFVKGLLESLLVFVLYKRLSPWMKGKMALDKPSRG